jgi:hypothetical protein
MTERLIVLAAQLSGVSPPLWDEFVTAFDEYCFETLSLMMKAAPDRLQQFQGRAQNATEILDLLRDCRQKARVIAERKNARSQ